MKNRCLTGRMWMKFAFEATFDELEDALDSFVSEVFSSLESEFLVMPKGAGFVEYSIFEQGYESLKRATAGSMSCLPDRYCG